MLGGCGGLELIFKLIIQNQLFQDHNFLTVSTLGGYDGLERTNF